MKMFWHLMNKVMHAALNLLARREYSQKELKQRLISRFPLADVEEVLAQCIRQCLLSDERFVESRIRHRVQQGYGPNWILQELQQYGIDTELVENYLPQDEGYWTEQALRVIQKKWGGQASPIPKIQRYMFQKGYCTSHIRQALNMMNTREI